MVTDVLIVEDESIVALDLENRLTSMGFHVVGRAGTGTAALEIVERTPPDVVLMDIQLRGDLDGIKTADRIQKGWDLPVIFLTAFSDAESLHRAKRSNAYGYLLKPFQERELSIAIELALYKHRTEQELRENRALLGVTLNNITEGIVTTDGHDRILFMNQAAEQLTGWSSSAAIGADSATVVCTDVGFSDGFSPNQWIRLTPRVGEPRTVAITSNELDQAVGNGGSRVLVIRDVTHEQEYRDRLVAAKEAAESAGQAKSDFLTRVTHELRTPLNSIVGMTSLLKNASDFRSAKEYIEILELSSHHLMALISDILDYARFDSGRLTLRRELFDPVAVVERVSRSFAMEAGKKGVRMVTVIAPATPRAVYGDEARFGQILRNTISNAVKFTAAGHIVVTLQPSSHARISVLIEDTGPGVAPEHRDRIFEDFSQLESPATRKAGGVGLGLSLVRRLVEAMEGSVDLVQSSSQGSIFAVEIPFTAAQDDSPGVGASSPTLRSVVTDDALIARSWEPWCAAAGISLLRLPWNDILTSPESYDLIITTSDRTATLPELDSLLVVSGIREPGGSADLHGQRENTVFEPVSAEAIVRSIYDTSPTVSGTDTEMTHGREPLTGEPLHVLVVDDDKGNLVLHRKLLESFGHRAVTATGGTEALALLKQESFDVAVLDIEMPDMDGWELAGLIRSGAGGDRCRTIPLVALSGHSTHDIEDRAKEVGFSEVLTKPVQIEGMIRVLREATAGAGTQCSQPEPASAIREALDAGDTHRARELLTEMKQHSPRSGVAETAFRLLLALRREDERTVQRLVTELEKEMDA